MTVALYFDDDCADSRLVRGQRMAGFEVTTSGVEGMFGSLDSEHLDWAAGAECVLISSNVKDFERLSSELLSRGLSHAGILLIHQNRYSLGERLSALLTFCHEVDRSNARDRVFYIRDFLRR